MTIRSSWKALSLVLLCSLPAARLARADETNLAWVYFGTYTGKKSQGIYSSRLDSTTGRLTPPELAAETASPSFLAVHPNHRFLYAVGETGRFGGKPAGSVSAFAIDGATGKLTLLNQQSSEGPGPCHISVDPSGRNALVANYGGGSVAVLPIQEDGRLNAASAFVQHTGSSVNRQRQKEPHAHSIVLAPDDRFAFVADLGLDRIMVYRFDPAKGSLAPHDPPFAKIAPGSGPRHFVFHPGGRFAYLVSEMLSTATAFSYQGGVLTELQTVSTLPAAFAGSSSGAEVQMHPSGRFLYASNRGHDSIAVFAIELEKGTLALVEHEATQGKVPRNFGIDPTGAFLLAANQNSDSVVVFRIDAKTGRLSPTGQSIEVGSPVCVEFVRAR